MSLNINQLYYKMLIMGSAGVGKSKLAMSIPPTKGVKKNVGYLAVESQGVRFHDIPDNYLIIDKINNLATFDAYMNKLVESPAIDTIVIDSITYLVELFMKDKKGKLPKPGKKINFMLNQKLGMQVQEWGELLDSVLGMLFAIEGLTNKNVIIVGHTDYVKGTIEIDIPTKASKKVYKYFDVIALAYIEGGEFYTTTIGESGVHDAKNRVGTPQTMTDSTLEKILTREK